VYRSEDSAAPFSDPEPKQSSPALAAAQEQRLTKLKAEIQALEEKVGLVLFSIYALIMLINRLTEALKMQMPLSKRISSSFTVTMRSSESITDHRFYSRWLILVSLRDATQALIGKVRCGLFRD